MSSEQPTCGWCGERHPMDFWCGQRLIGLQEQVDALEIHRQGLSGRLGQVVKWTHGIDDKVDGLAADEAKLRERVSALEVVTQELRGCATDMAKFDVDLREIGARVTALEGLTKLERSAKASATFACVDCGAPVEVVDVRCGECVAAKTPRPRCQVTMLDGTALDGLTKLHGDQIHGCIRMSKELYKALNERVSALENNWTPALAASVLTMSMEGLSRRLDAVEKQQCQCLSRPPATRRSKC